MNVILSSLNANDTQYYGALGEVTLCRFQTLMHVHDDPRNR